MTRASFLLALVLLAWPWSAGRAQALYVGGFASSPQGDYLRGVGVAAYGMGVYNERTAVATSINADTAIRVNEYMAAVVKYENHLNAVHRRAVFEHNRSNYEKIRRRILENPEERDMLNGAALNAILQQMMDPQISESSFRFDPVPLPVDVVRTIPFKLGEQGVTFSMQRLSTKGKNKWPVALQDDRFAVVRRGYERALDEALEQQVEGKMSLEAIKGVESAVDDLFRTLDLVLVPSKDKLYIEAKNRLAELKAMAQLLKSHKVEIAIGEIDRYGGTTVNDLRVFMQKYNLRFGVAEGAAERGLYPELYAALVQQRDKVNAGGGPRGR